MMKQQIGSMLEKELEAYLRRKVQAAGGLFFKWENKAVAGTPDRIAIFPGGRIAFVEMKRPGGVLSPQQVKVHEMLRVRGCDVYVIWNKEQAEEFLNERT